MSEANSTSRGDQYKEDNRRELRRQLDKELHMLIECKPVYFVAAERLGMIEQSIAAMASTPSKRKRQIAFKEIERILKGLKVIPKDCHVVGISYGCMPGGEAGMFVACSVPTTVLGTIPEVLG